MLTRVVSSSPAASLVRLTLVLPIGTAVLALALLTSVAAKSGAQSTTDCRRSSGSSQNWHETNRNELVTWRSHWGSSDCSVDIRSAGEVKFNAGFTDIAGIERGGWLEISEARGNITRRLTIRPDASGRLSRAWNVDGHDVPWDENAQRWLADLLVDLDRHTAMGVDYRYPVLFARGGAPAVIAEAELMESDFAQSVYLRRLIESAKLSDAEYARVVAVTSRDMHSDYEMSRVLRAVAERSPLDNDDMRASYLRAVERMSSDYERSRVLQTIVAQSGTSHEVGAAAVKAAGTFHSDYERSRVLLAAIGNKSLGSEDVLPIIETITRSSSDYEKARVLLAVAARWPITGDARKAYLRAADTIHSDYENRRVLSALVNQEPR